MEIIPRTASSKNIEAARAQSDLVKDFSKALMPKKPWDSIINFAEHRSFCGKKLYPRQETLLKLIYLETENMSSYDLDVIEQWRTHSNRKKDPWGVQEDIWDRVKILKEQGYTHFPHIQAVQGRRASKGMVGGILGAERIAYLVSLDDPKEYFGFDAESTYLSVVATNILQAKRFQFADIRGTVEHCKYLEKNISTSNEFYLSLRTAADMRKIAEMQARRIPIEHEIATIRALAMSSNSSSGRGGTGFANFFDEFAFLVTGTNGPRTGDEVYEAYQPSLDQFGKESLTYMPSSPFTKTGRFFELYTQGKVLLREYLEREGKLDTQRNRDELEYHIEEEFVDTTADPEMLVVQLPSWELYQDYSTPEITGSRFRFKRAIQYPPTHTGLPENERMIRLKQRDPTKFRVEREGQFAEVMDAYLDPEKVDQMFEPFWPRKIDGRIQYRKLEETTHGNVAFIYHGHVDPSRTNCNFAVAIGHLEKSPIPEVFNAREDPSDNESRIVQKKLYFPHVIIDFLRVWKPEDYEDHTVPYTEINEELKRIITRFPGLKRFTYDQWNSAYMIADQKKSAASGLRITEAPFTDKANQERAEKFKAALNLGWVHCYRDNLFNNGTESLLENELKFLSEKAGKVVKQTIGPVTTKDLADAAMEVTVSLLGKYLDKWQRELLGKVGVAGGSMGGHPKAGGEVYSDSIDFMSPQQAKRAGVRDVLNSNRARAMLPNYAAPSRGVNGISRNQALSDNFGRNIPQRKNPWNTDTGLTKGRSSTKCKTTRNSAGRSGLSTQRTNLRKGK